MKLRIRTRQKTLRQDERGLATVEYIILLVLIAMLGLIAWQRLADAQEEESESQVANVSALDW